MSLRGVRGRRGIQTETAVSVGDVTRLMLGWLGYVSFEMVFVDVDVQK